MKKIVLALLCVAFVAFTGCKKDKAPTIKFITTGNYTNSNTELHVGEKAVFGVEATSDMFVGKGINKITVAYSNGDPDQVFNYNPAEDSPTNSWVKKFDAPGNVTLTATAYDDNGETATATLTVTVLEDVPVEHKPEISFLSGENYVSDSATLYTMTAYTFGVRATNDGNPQAPLITKVDVQYSNDNGIYSIYDEATGQAAIAALSWDKTFAEPGAVTITATVTDAAGEQATAEMSVVVIEHELSISFLSGGTYVTDGMPLYTNTPYAFGVKVSNDGTPQAPLITKVDVQYSNENGIFNIYDDATGQDAIAALSWNKTFAQPGTIVVTATATDAAGKKASASISVLVTTLPEPDDNPFIGAYANENLKVTGHITLSMPPVNQDIDYDLPGGGFVINPGETDDAVVVTMLIDGAEYSMNATISGNTITFEETEVEFQTNVSGYNVKIRAMLGGTGTLDNGVIDYHGVIGESVQVSIMTFNNIPATVSNGKLEGEFTKLPPTK